MPPSGLANGPALPPFIEAAVAVVFAAALASVAPIPVFKCQLVPEVCEPIVSDVVKSSNRYVLVYPTAVTKEGTAIEGPAFGMQLSPLGMKPGSQLQVAAPPLTAHV